jgi:endoglucanase
MKSIQRLSILVILLCFHYSSLSQSTEAIKLNQLGFYPHAPKIAVVTAEVSSPNFYITSPNGKDTFYTGTLSAVKQSANSSIKTRIADFSTFTKKGRYVIATTAGNSYPFDIKDDVANDVAIAALKAFYYQRVSMPLEEKYAGKWHRPAGHPDTAVLIHGSAASATRPEGTVISSPGGWYDAGDYNKYIVNSGITMGTLLSAYEDFPDYFKKLKTNIPESNDAIPDILNEIIYNLRWMLTMQDPTDGGVYNKCTNAAFDGMVMPGVTKEPRYVVAKGTAATLDFAAVMAQSARIFKKFQKELPGLADSCSKAAVKAWQWAQQFPSILYNQNLINLLHKPAITTGGYGDRNFKDEWFWAATELYLTTKEEKYYDTVKAHITTIGSLPSWGNVGLLGFYSIRRLLTKDEKHKSQLIVVIPAIVQMGLNYVKGLPENAFNTPMGQSKGDFVWGSNSVATNQGIVMIQAYLLVENEQYINPALSSLDYLLGRNATGYCFVTGFGSKSPMFPHHRQSEADGIKEPVPGLLVGGPNPGMQDKCKYEFTEPETAYTDLTCSYASNEIAINWNAPLVYLAAAVEALKKKAGYTSK